MNIKITRIMKKSVKIQPACTNLMNYKQLKSPRMYPFSLTDCSVGRFMRNFISLVRTLFGSVSPAELDECVTLGLLAEKFQTFIDTPLAVPNGSTLMTSTAQPTSTLIGAASKPVVPSRVGAADLVVQVSVLLVRRVVLVLLEGTNKHASHHHVYIF